MAAPTSPCNFPPRAGAGRGNLRLRGERGRAADFQDAWARYLAPRQPIEQNIRNKRMTTNGSGSRICCRDVKGLWV
jgi:hypothetical protein